VAGGRSRIAALMGGKMIKKKTKKLTLNRESLVRLDQWQLREVAAGVSADVTGCTQCTCRTTCKC